MRVSLKLLLPHPELPVPLLVHGGKLLLLHLIMPQLHVQGHGLQMCRLLNELLVLLQDLLQLGVLLHESLVLEACALLLRQLPLRGCGLQLLQARSFCGVPRCGADTGHRVIRWWWGWRLICRWRWWGCIFGGLHWRRGGCRSLTGRGQLTVPLSSILFCLFIF